MALWAIGQGVLAGLALLPGARFLYGPASAAWGLIALGLWIGLRQ